MKVAYSFAGFVVRAKHTSVIRSLFGSKKLLLYLVDGKIILWITFSSFPESSVILFHFRKEISRADTYALLHKGLFVLGVNARENEPTNT